MSGPLVLWTQAQISAMSISAFEEYQKYLKYAENI